MLEQHLISKYLKKLSKNNSYALNLNDDVFYDKSKKLVLSIDTYNDKVHFPNFQFPDLVIKKIIRSSISDLICKGVKPKFYFLSASGPKGIFNKKSMKIISSSLKDEQKKFNIKISGGDTSLSKNLSFTVVVCGYNKKIIRRNKSKINYDIYVTGYLGDSKFGLYLIKKKIIIRDNNSYKYFIKKYYCPDIPYKYINIINSYANSSIDISDGLLDDMKKLINKQNLSFKIDILKLPVSPKLKKNLKLKTLLKRNYLFSGDDYQILFTASKRYRKNILNLSKKMNQKVTIIGEILNKSKKSSLMAGNKNENIKDYKGYSHEF